ncbi:hypothetical protein [Methanosarcina soligelidi]|nr:hypothetical protein [Methanosarcina soligelidi]
MMRGKVWKTTVTFRDTIALDIAFVTTSSFFIVFAFYVGFVD